MTHTLDSYRLLGRSGLRVSPLALGTATFGTDWGWGAGQDDARRLFDRYVDLGGNFVDTANTYTDGSSERMLGEFVHGQRDRLVLATKYTTLTRPGDPNSGGAHRKSLIASVEESLRRLGTDYIDLLYLHVWDQRTPVDEIVRALDDLVRQGKVLYIGISNAPAWQVARMQTLADLRGWSPLVAMQIEYNLIERGGERDIIPMSQELGLGVVPYSPLAGGILSGKYRREDISSSNDAPDFGGSRKAFNLAMGTVTEHNLDIADVVSSVAQETGHTEAQIALAWTLQNSAVTASIIGARTTEQLNQNLGALDVTLDEQHLARLDRASAIDLGFPHAALAGEHLRTVTTGDMTIEHRRSPRG